MDKIPLIQKGDSGSFAFGRRSLNLSPILFVGFIFFFGIFIIAAIIRLFQLTVVRGVYYRSLSDQNRVREVVIEAKRGSILDRKGVVLAYNDEPEESTSASRLLSQRTYPFKESMSHVLGYRQLADKEDFRFDPCIHKLVLADKSGKKGIEKLMECQLRGQNGKKLIEVQATGKVMGALSAVPPIPGQTITLALDSYLQNIAFTLLAGRKGAVVAVKPVTGELLSLVSSPSFDVQAFEDTRSNYIAGALEQEDKPLFNRATEGVYPPGSTFKLFVAAAGLEEKAITEKTLITDNGFIKAGPLLFHNWYYLEYGKTDGEVDLIKALQRSNDIYFYELGAKLTPKKIKKWGELFGLHTRTGFGLEEAEGVLPSSFWKEDTLGERWYLGDTYNLSIGQGYVSATPLQIALGTAVFANGGSYCKPLLLKKESIYAPSLSCRPLQLSRKTYESVRAGMKAACETGGTGWPFFDFPVKVGCKTGTAESHAASGKPHAWFTVFAPYENPEIVLTVLIEEGGQGSEAAAPIAKDLLKAYFEKAE